MILRLLSMTGLRQLVQESPPGTGIAVAGRQHFFDTEDERHKALGQKREQWKEVRLNEFDDSQIEELKAQFGYSGVIPPWVPSRPLLLTSLFAQGLGSDASDRLAILQDPAAGWDYLLDEVSERESRIENSGVSGENIRRILEALATLAREKDSGVGPLSVDELIAVFRLECGFTPTDESLKVLQRLPGLGRDHTTAEESRAFVDTEFADACAAGDFHRFCTQPFDQDIASRVSSVSITLGSTGLGLSALQLNKSSFNQGMFRAVLKAIQRNQELANGGTAADIVNLGLRMGLEIEEDTAVMRVHIENFEIEGDRSDMHRVTFSDCMFERLILSDPLPPDSCPVFRGCLIQDLEGRVSEGDLPPEKFVDCYVDTYASASTTVSSVLDLKIPAGAKVLITLLRKLFVQSLSGRKENALFKGLDGEHQAKVKEVISLLVSHGLIVNSGRAGETIWIPVRRHTGRALGIIAAPSGSKDRVMIEARKL